MSSFRMFPQDLPMKHHLFSLSPEELSSQMEAFGDKLTLVEARRLQAHILGDGQLDFLLKNPIKKTLQKKLVQNFDIGLLKIVERIEDPSDKSVRYLFEAPDKMLIEAVRIPLAKSGCFSV